MWPFKKKKKTLQEAIVEDAFAEEHFPVETGELPAENSADEELGLDDIMKEFSMEEVPSAAPEETVAVPGETVSSDTVRLDIPVTREQSAVTGDTIRMEPVVTD